MPIPENAFNIIVLVRGTVVGGPFQTAALYKHFRDTSVKAVPEDIMILWDTPESGD